MELYIGHYHWVGRKRNGQYVVAGNNDYGQCNIGTWENVKRIILTEYATIGLHTDGTISLAGVIHKYEPKKML